MATEVGPAPAKSKSPARMFVIKRNGQQEDVKFDKITERISRLMDIPPELSRDLVDPVLVCQKVVSGVFPGVKTTELDNLAAETAAYMSTIHPDYGVLAARISISNLQKQTLPSLSETARICYEYKSPRNGQHSPLISEEVYQIIKENAKVLDQAIDYNRDFSYDYFAFKTLERSYLFRVDGKIVERPQHMLMRVAIGIHKKDIRAAIETYELMSQKFFTHATPTLFNAGTPCPQMSSCFLVAMKEDSIEGIYETLKRCALISKSAGGIGISVHNIRAANSYIRGTNGTSNGLVPMLRVFNDTARYVDQGGGKRKGAFAVYLEPWHADIFEFLELRKNTGKEEQRARDLFYALWIPDLFMERVEQDSSWSLFCPNEATGLHLCWGEEFKALYTKYEQTPGLSRKTIRARELWFTILEAQIETGTPYMLFKDACNRKSNHQHLGTIRSSNLCTEIIEYTSADEIAVCNLCSLALPKFVKKFSDGTIAFDHQKLYEVTKVAVRNLNKIIDGNYYPLEEARNSNMRHRPVGVGVQGLADVFIMMRLPFESEGAAKLNADIFETIYFAALTASKDIAREEGTYPSYQGCPVSQGILQFDMWGVTPSSGRWDWAALREEIRKHGVRNSLLIAPMPTASTSQILGNNEAFEPYTSNIYTRRVLSGEFTVINRHLIEDLMALNLWRPDIKNKIIAHNGSIQNIPEIPQELKDIYKTVWEISMKTVIDLAADRGAYIDQSQSLNCFLAKPDLQKLTSMHFYSWKKGLKTGMYYLRTRPAADAIKFTVDQNLLKSTTETPSPATPNQVQPPSPLKKQSVSDTPASPLKKPAIEEEGPVCRMEEGCLVCGS